MTVIVSKPAVNLREELASLRNQGGYQEQQFYFDGLVTNGTFDTDVSGWTAVNATATVSSGVVEFEQTTTSGLFFSDNIVVSAGKLYEFSFFARRGTMTSTKLSVRDQTAGADIIPATAYTVGTSELERVSVTFVTPAGCTAVRVYPFRDNGGALGTAFVDNISVFEVDANDDVIHRMPKGWVPKDVYEDGLLQREGAANDYEVVYDGFDYFVKPTVAPSATTQTCVIGVKA